MVSAKEGFLEETVLRDAVGRARLSLGGVGRPVPEWTSPVLLPGSELSRQRERSSPSS